MALPSPWWLALQPANNLRKSIRDNVFRDKIETPRLGSIVYCDLLFGYAEHSGVYVGNGRIAQLSGKGNVEAVSPKKFIGNTTAISIYVSCLEKKAVGDPLVAMRASKMVGEERDYNLLWDNCHQFASGCLSGDFENANNFLWMLKDRTADVLGANTWRVWDLETAELFE